MSDSGIARACEALVRGCADLKASESALIVSDPVTRELGQSLAGAASRVTPRVVHRTIPPLAMHGAEPPADVALEMTRHDVVFGITRFSMAHSQARNRATALGVRYLSLPDYSPAVMKSEALLADFRGITGLAQRLADVFTAGSTVTLSSALGTRLTADISGRVANAAPGWCWQRGVLASPPDAEANVCPIEDASEGVIVVDGSIPCAELGLLDTPLTLTVERGRVVGIEGVKASTLHEVFDRLKNPLTRVVAEIGVGLNPLARLQGYMLEDEGCLGTVHVGIGSNATMGGKNSVAFHLDHVFRQATVLVDGRPIMEDGRLAEAFAP